MFVSLLQPSLSSCKQIAVPFDCDIRHSFVLDRVSLYCYSRIFTLLTHRTHRTREREIQTNSYRQSVTVYSLP